MRSPAIDKHAILADRAAFVDSLRVGHPKLGDLVAMWRRVSEILDWRWFANDGPLVRECEGREERAWSLRIYLVPHYVND